jgi:hypothetical protein
MLERNNPAVFLGAWLDACCLWRMYMPHLAYHGSSFYIFAQRPNWDVVAGKDVVVVQRCCTQPQFDFLKTAGALGMRIVYDLDDDIWQLPSYNPAFSVLNAHREGFNACIRMVDVVSVSTRVLAKSLRKHVKFMTNMRTHKDIPIVVAENRIAECMFVEPVRKPELIIGWAGSSSHAGDFGMVEEPLVNVSRDNPNVRIEFRGCEPTADSPLRKLPNYRHKLWSPVAEFGGRLPLWGWSIALAPVTEHVFNDSKSAIKMVEAAWCKIPCLASYVQPYVDFCRHDKELKWLLCPGASAWESKLRTLINEPAMRDELGQRMWNVVREHYSWNRPHEGWDEVFQLARPQ